MPTCPKGHPSTAEDYCDECGAPMAAPPAALARRRHGVHCGDFRRALPGVLHPA